MHAATLRPRYASAPSPRLSPSAIVAIVAAHAGLITLLASFNVVAIAPPLSTLMVQIIAPSAPTVNVAPPQPSAPENKPLARPRASPPKPPVERARLAAPADAPSALASTPAPVDTPPTPAPNVAASAGAPTASGSTNAPASTSQPRFDANYLQNPAPAYPPLSRKLGEEGRVVLRVLVDRSGRPTQIEVKTASGSARLDQSAQDAVGRWKFVPAKHGDEAVDAWVLVPIVFNLRS